VKKPSPWLLWLSPLAIGLLLAWTPTDNGPTLCPFAALTGHACPGCGLTRAMAYLVRGDLDRAIVYHPLSLVLALGAAAWVVWLIGNWRRGWRPPSIKTVNIALIAAGVLLMGVWFTRMATGTLPPV
jgi:hypothetical protein